MLRPCPGPARHPLRVALACLAALAAGSAARAARAQTVADIIPRLRPCSTAGAAGLSNQILRTLLCRHPGSLVEVSTSGTRLVNGGALHMYLTPDARSRLYSLAASYGTIRVNDTYRTVLDQYLYARSDQPGTADNCYGPLAPAGSGRHETGTAVDTSNGAAIDAATSNAVCCRPLGSDVVHFECRAGCAAGTSPPGTPVRVWGVEAFQHLWNVNHPGDTIAESGTFSAATESALRRSPAAGFPTEGCPVDRDGDGSPAGADCDDANAAVHPGAPEVCNNRDDNCNGHVDEALARACGGGALGECRPGTSLCARGAWTACIGAVGPAPETCDGRDNDCNGDADEDQVCEREEVAFGAGIEGRSTDVDGDGRSDACARTPGGFECLMASGTGFARTVPGPTLGDAGGPPSLALAAMLRMGDLDGDGRADLCVRGASAIECWRTATVPFDRPVPPLPTPPGMTNLFLADVDGDGREDVCVRATRGLVCSVSTGAAFGAEVVLTALSDAAGFARPERFGTIQLGDLDGDRAADVCARTAAGMRCWLSTHDGFGPERAGPAWTDASEFAEMPYWSTIRLADVDNDGRAELCARTRAGYRCYRALAEGFGPALAGPDLAAGRGWDRPESYTTLRLADVTGDGALDLCGRAGSGVECWPWTVDGFGASFAGPALTDTMGWNHPQYYRSLRLADITGDGRADLCVRAFNGLRCYASTGTGFAAPWQTSHWRDLDGFADLARVATLRITGDGRPHGATAGCSCRSTPGSHGGRGGGLAGALLALAAWSRRRRGARDRVQ